MTKGVLMFAFDSPKYKYTKMAEFTAKRIKQYLNLPVTIVTAAPIESPSFDNVIASVPDPSNTREWGIWINKNRYMAYDLSPYDETLLLDTDYIVNSTSLLKLFPLTKDIMCHSKTEFMMEANSEQEKLSPYGIETVWATVICFKKTQFTKHVFECVRMVQENYEHYSALHGFPAEMYRNDYALTIALRLVQGHLLQPENIIPWPLLHVGRETKTEYNKQTNEFTFTKTVTKNNKFKQEYIQTRNIDFHMLNKDDLIEIIEEAQ